MFSLSLLTAGLLSSTLSFALDYSLDPHQFEFSARTRVASVNGDENGKSASLLLRFDVESEWTDQITTQFNLDHVELGWEDEFSNGVHFNGNPVIPDAGGTDINQALIHYSPTNTLQLTLGREAINLGNERFIGANVFWQNEQSFDVVGWQYNFATSSNIQYRYIDNANRITGDDAGKRLSDSDINFVQNNGLRPLRFLGDHQHKSHLLFAQFQEWDHSRIQAYIFDIDNIDAPAVSNQTVGGRYEFKSRTGNLRTLAHAEIAWQKRTELNNAKSLLYFDLGAGFGFKATELSLNIERLGAEGGVSFTSPLASLHDHNGWADKFLITPDTGLSDYSLQMIWRKNPWKLDARYHVFYGVDDSSRLGKELDIDLSFNVNKRNVLLLRYAKFSADDVNFSDERRLFFQYLYNF